MRTLDNHLAGVTANTPHPASYRPDLPLLLVAHTDDRYDEGFADGFDEGEEDGKEAGYRRGYGDGERDTESRIRRATEKPSA